jgi:hypothetical protein
MTHKKRADLDGLEKALKNADWSYEYSDDPQVYRSGEKSVKTAYLIIYEMRERYGKSDPDIKGLLARYGKDA